jgi:hypothetical protein
MVVIIYSCHKDYPKPITKTDLISRSWKLSAATSNSIDVLSLLDNCEKDNVLSFTKDGKFTEDEGQTKCDPGDPQTESGKWSFKDSEKTITVSYPGEPDETFTKVDVTATKLEFVSVQTLDGNTVNIDLTFVPK